MFSPAEMTEQLFNYPDNLHSVDGVFLLHASHASATVSQVIVCAQDTDVAVLCMHYCGEIGVDLWFLEVVQSQKKNDRFIHITEVITKLDHEFWIWIRIE